MFWYKKSNAKHGKIKIPDFQIAVNSICEEKVYLWTNDITFWAHLFMGRPMLIFSKKVLPSLTTSIFMTQIRHLLRWLSCFPRLYMKSNPQCLPWLHWFTWKYSFITDYTGYLILKTSWKKDLSLNSQTKMTNIK